MMSSDVVVLKKYHCTTNNVVNSLLLVVTDFNGIHAGLTRSLHALVDRCIGVVRRVPNNSRLAVHLATQMHCASGRLGLRALAHARTFEA